MERRIFRDTLNLMPRKGSVMCEECLREISVTIHIWKYADIERTALIIVGRRIQELKAHGQIYLHQSWKSVDKGEECIWKRSEPCVKKGSQCSRSRNIPPIQQRISNV